MELQVPAALKAEHLELRAELDKAVSSGGMLGDAAEAVAHLLYPHLEEEEEYVLPPLSILPLLTGGEVTPEMGASLPMTNKLRTELPNLVQDHRAIDAELEKLAQVAKDEQRWEYARCVKHEKGESNPFTYVPTEEIYKGEWLDAIRMVREYDPSWEFVAVLLKQGRESAYRVGMPSRKLGATHT